MDSKLANKIAYRATLTSEEYHAACFMAERGYLGGWTDHATEEEWSDDEKSVELRFTEPDAWEVQAQCEADPDAVWALTDLRTSLGQKFQAFLDTIV